MLSEMPVTGSVMVQGILSPGQLMSGELESVVRSRLPISSRSPKTCRPSALISQLWPASCWKPRENCW